MGQKEMKQKDSRRNTKEVAGKRTKKKGGAVKNREFALIAYLFLALFLAQIGYFTYFQVVRSEDAINNPYNKRQESFAKSVIRGDILSADGMTLATTKVDASGTETREYPYGRMFAHVIGYADRGKTGVESIANFNLLRSHSFVLDRIKNELSGEKNQGDTVVTTLNYDLQKAAYDALGDYDGAVVVMEPSTGKILAMVSKPDFDPNAIDDDWDRIVSQDNKSSVLLNRVTQGSYTPGSTFKIFTTLEYLRENGGKEDFEYQCNGSASSSDGTKIRCYGGEVHGTVNLQEAFAESCNAAYSTIGLSLNRTKFKNNCESLLFNSQLPLAFPYTKSSFSIDKSSSDGALMQASIGQGKTTVSPMHMAMVVSAIANNGLLMKPYVVDSTINEQGTVVEQYEPEEYEALLTQNESEILMKYMRAAVTDGTASKLMSDSYTAGGKTGSAEISDSSDETHSWFVGYAGNGEKEDIVIAVIVEKKGNGSKYAVPIAKKVFDVYFK